MPAEWDYRVLRPVVYLGQSAYQPGEGIMQQVVDDLGLVVGEDVAPARADVLPLPNKNAKRSEWALYASGQPNADMDEIDSMTRDELRDRYGNDAMGAEPTKGAKK
jgi:hypothetical protein